MAMGVELLMKQVLNSLGISPQMLEGLADGFSKTFDTLIKGQGRTDRRLRRIEIMLAEIAAKQGVEIPPETENEDGPGNGDGNGDGHGDGDGSPALIAGS